jgi:tetratricopeptide (TPR) repeat protein
MTHCLRVLLMVFASVIIAPASLALADGGAPSGPAASDPNFIAGKQAIDAKDWKRAIERLSKLKADADVLNYLGYAHRNLGNYDEAFSNYKRALALDFYHRGAHEYIGEAYLLTNNLAMAEQHLANLNGMCGPGCEEYKDLARAVAEYKKKH